MSSGNKTTSIPRPRTGRRASTSPPRASQSRRADLTRPIPLEARLVQRGRSRWLLGAIAALIVVALTAALFVLPVRAWMNQREDLAERRGELAALQEATGALERDIERLQTPEGIENAAREELGYVEQGERRVAVVDVPAGSTDLPGGWPYDVVEQIIAVRALPSVEPVPTSAG